MEGEIKDFDDVYEGERLFADSRQVEFSDILDKELVIRAYRELDSSYGGKFLVIQAELDGESISFATGSTVLQNQMKGIADELPIKARIIKPEKKRYYTFKGLKK